MARPKTQPIDGFADRLRCIRKDRGISQEELGAKVGVDQTQISFYELGKDCPSLHRLTALADVLEVSADELLGRTSRVPSSMKRRPRLLKRIERVFELPEKDQRNAVEVIEGLLARKGLLQAAGQ